MLTGTRDYLNEAEDLINRLDQQMTPTVQIKLRTVEVASAVSIAARLQEIVLQMRGAVK